MHSHLTNSADHAALRCARCHYVLDDPSKTKVCPECGLDVQASLDLQSLLASPHDLASSIAPACRMLLGGAIITTLGVPISFALSIAWAGGPWYKGGLVGGPMIMIGSIIANMGAIMLATSPMTNREAHALRVAKWIVHITTSIKLVVHLIWLVSLVFIIFNITAQRALNPAVAIINETYKLFFFAILPISGIQWCGMQHLYKCVLDAVGLRRNAKHVLWLLIAPFAFACCAVWCLYVTLHFRIYPIFEALGLLFLVAIPTSIAITWLIPTRAIARRLKGREGSAAQ